MAKGKVPAKCFQCKQVFKSINECGQHGVSQGHKHSPSYFCADCNTTFGKRKQRQVHLDTTGHMKATTTPKPADPKASSSAAGSQTVTCLECVPDRQFRDAAALAAHRQAVHHPCVQAKAATTSVPPAKPATADSQKKGKSMGPFGCTKCTLDFPTEQVLQTHYNESSAHPRCHACGLGFLSMVSYVAHKSRCPPPGSYTNGVSGSQDTADPSVSAGSMKGKGRAIEQDKDAASTLSDAFSRVGTSSDGVRPMGSTTERERDTTSIPEPSAVTSNTMTVSETPKRQERITTASQAEYVDSTGLSASTAGTSSTYNAASTRDLLESQVEKVYSTLQGDPVSPLRQSSSSYPQASRYASVVNGASRSASPFSANSRSAPRVVPLDMPPQTPRTSSAPQSWRAAFPSAHNAKRRGGAAIPSFHCRSCLGQPVEPVTTMCGHIFCHGCIVQEIATRMCCPVCQRPFLVRLHLEVEE